MTVISISTQFKLEKGLFVLEGRFVSFLAFAHIHVILLAKIFFAPEATMLL